MVKELRSREYVVEVADEDFRKKEARSYRNLMKMIKSFNKEEFFASAEKAIIEKGLLDKHDEV